MRGNSRHSCSPNIHMYLVVYNTVPEVIIFYISTRFLCYTLGTPFTFHLEKYTEADPLLTPLGYCWWRGWVVVGGHAPAHMAICSRRHTHVLWYWKCSSQIFSSLEGHLSPLNSMSTRLVWDREEWDYGRLCQYNLIPGYGFCEVEVVEIACFKQHQNKTRSGRTVYATNLNLASIHSIGQQMEYILV